MYYNYTMKEMVILDSICVNCGDLSWGVFDGLVSYKIYERTAYLDIVERCKNAEIVLTNKCTIDQNIIEQLPNLKYLGELATGYNNIDIAYAKEKGIVVTNVPSYSTNSVVQCILGLILELTISIGYHNKTVKNGAWERCPDFCYYKRDMTELSGKTLGIIGYGQIGQKLRIVANALGMKVAVFNKGKKYQAEQDFKSVESLKELLNESDFVSLNCPLNASNQKMINSETLKMMKPTAYLINTARGGLIDESALREALDNESILGAAVDVLSEEPAKADNPLLKAQNIIITPHIAWATKEARGRLIEIASRNLKSYLKNGIDKTDNNSFR